MHRLIYGLVLFLFLVCGLYVAPFIDKSSYHGELSDHFDGQSFFNPGMPTTTKSPLKLIEWLITRDREPWPKQITNEPHSPILTKVATNTVRATFINHATMLLQTRALTLITDPIWSERASPFSWAGPKRVRKPGISFSELPKIDVVLISHNHYDHLDVTTLKRLDNRDHPLFIVPLGVGVLLAKQGISKVIELDWWQSHTIGAAKITFLPTRHWSARWLNDRSVTLWGSYGIALPQQKIYFAGDTAYSPFFKTISARWGRPDLALLPIGAYLPTWFMQDNHVNPEEAVKAHLDLAARQSIAIHYHTFQLSDEGFNQPIADLSKALKHYHVKAEKFRVLKEGEAWSIKSVRSP